MSFFCFKWRVGKIMVEYFRIIRVRRDLLQHDNFDGKNSNTGCKYSHFRFLKNVQLLNAKPRKVELDGGFYRVYDEACRVLQKIKLDNFQRNFSSFLLNNCSYASRWSITVLSLLVEYVNLHKTCLEMYNCNYQFTRRELKVDMKWFKQSNGNYLCFTQ